jgi:electron transport complex protein RnfC
VSILQAAKRFFPSMAGLPAGVRYGRPIRGGIHPPYGKDLAADVHTEEMPLPARVVIPMVQHTGAPAKPAVAIGAVVRKGQKIGEAQGAVSAPVHASISGKVTAIGNFLHPSGREIPSIVIESDGTEDWAEDVVPPAEPEGLGPGALRKIISEAGIVGMGGAAFPTAVKLNPPAGKKIETLVVNGAECEPYLTSDHRLMAEHSVEIVDGVRFLKQILGVSRVVIGIEDNKPGAIRAMAAAARNLDGSEVVALETKYPQGGEKQVIKAVLDREVPSGGLPMDVGVVVQNVGTAYAVHEAVRHGRPLVRRIVTVTGPGIAAPKNLWARIGTPIKDLIAAAGGFKGEPGRVIMGGPMMGSAVYTLHVPVVKGSGGVLVLHRSDTVTEEYRSCIRCASCVNACPMGLMPNFLSVSAEALNFDEGKKYHPYDCIECGCCDYVCPSRRPIAQQIRFIKTELRKKAEKAKTKAA